MVNAVNLHILTLFFISCVSPHFKLKVGVFCQSDKETRCGFLEAMKKLSLKMQMHKQLLFSVIKGFFANCCCVKIKSLGKLCKHAVFIFLSAQNTATHL